MNGRTWTPERRASVHLAVQAILTLLLTAVSYVATPWSEAYSEVFFSIRGRLMSPGMPPTPLNLLTPAIILLMVVNQAMSIPVIIRSRLATSRWFLVGGSVLLALISILSFPAASHDLELYHAHARMAIHGVNPYQLTPRQVFGETLSSTMPWPDQLAPYGPLSIGMHALLVGYIGDPWAAALALKVFYALVSVIFVWIILRPPGGHDPWKAAAAVTVGWSPLLMLEFAGNGHTDSLMGVLCALAIIAFLRGRAIMPWLLLGVASLVKLEAILFLPILVVACGRDRPNLVRRLALPGITAIVVLGGYLVFGGPQNALPGLREEASKVLRSIPQFTSYLSGLPAARAAWGLRVAFVAVLAGITWSVARGRSVLEAAPLLYAAYLLLAKSFLQPWHGALLVYLLAVAHLLGQRAKLLELAVATWSVSAVLGGYSYLIATRNLSPAYQATSTVIMVLPVLLATLGYSIVHFARRHKRMPVS